MLLIRRATKNSQVVRGRCYPEVYPNGVEAGTAVLHQYVVLIADFFSEDATTVVAVVGPCRVQKRGERFQPHECHDVTSIIVVNVVGVDVVKGDSAEGMFDVDGIHRLYYLFLACNSSRRALGR